jgi:hypothetical protein
MDALRAIKVTSAIDLTALDWLHGAPDKVYYGSQNHAFPDVLVSADWIDVEGWNSSPHWSFDAVPYFKVTEGYRGPCIAEITERYTSNPQSVTFQAAVPVPTAIQGGTSTVGYAFATAFPAAAIARTWQTPNSIHDDITMTHTTGIPAHADTGAWFSDIPATPTTVTPTGFITVNVQPEKWQFGLWVYRIIKIKHP